MNILAQLISRAKGTRDQRARGMHPHRPAPIKTPKKILHLHRRLVISTALSCANLLERLAALKLEHTIQRRCA